MRKSTRGGEYNQSTLYAYRKCHNKPLCTINVYNKKETQ
jgi:hypothetical protein